MDKKSEIQELLAKIMELVDEILDEKEIVDEDASMGGGSIAGAGNGFELPQRRTSLRRRTSEAKRRIYLPPYKK